MKPNLKIFINAALTFALIFFVVYLLIIIISFFGCCTGITALFYDKIVWVLLSLGVIVFAFCFYNNCNKKRQKLWIGWFPGSI